MKDFRTLQVWQKGHAITLEIYRITRTFPPQEMYGLVSQMRRSAAFIPTNIAEGCGRNGDAELCRFLHIAAGSASELEYQLILVHDLKYLEQEPFQQLNQDVNQIKRMLNMFSQKLTAKS